MENTPTIMTESEAREREEELQEALDEANAVKEALLAPPEIEGVSEEMVLLSYRDAIGRAMAATQVEDLGDLLYQARTIGDRMLARGVLYAAIEKTSLGPEAQLEVLGGYLNDYREDMELAQRFVEKANAYKALENGGKQFV
jgi:hypothetical protein